MAFDRGLTSFSPGCSSRRHVDLWHEWLNEQRNVTRWIQLKSNIYFSRWDDSRKYSDSTGSLHYWRNVCHRCSSSSCRMNEWMNGRSDLYDKTKVLKKWITIVWEKRRHRTALLVVSVVSHLLIQFFQAMNTISLCEQEDEIGDECTSWPTRLAFIDWRISSSLRREGERMDIRSALIIAVEYLPWFGSIMPNERHV